MIRIQRRRTRGWRQPHGTVYVGRGSRWGNPWSLVEVNRAGHHQPDGSPWTLDDVLRWYAGWAEEQLRADPTWLDALMDAEALSCWCETDECHATILISMVERRRSELLAAA